jgi:hypothetical protein
MAFSKIFPDPQKGAAYAKTNLSNHHLGLEKG